jgi:RND family efflux transporter MFP subunit
VERNSKLKEHLTGEKTFNTNMRNVFYLLIISALVGSCGSKESETVTNNDTQVEERLTIATAPVEGISATETVTASGVLSSKSELKLAFKTGGLIKRMYVTEGQFVKSGQLLAEIDTEEIDAQVDQGNVGLEKANRDLERVKRLVADSAATLQNLQDVTSAYKAAKQGLRVGNFNQKLSKIYAPMSGRILRKIAEQGELITPFAPALILGTGGAATQLTVGVTDREIVQLKKGYPATVKLDAYPGEIFSAQITQIAQIVNPATGTFEVELAVNPQGKQFISGFVGRAEILPPGNKQILAVPIESLVEADGNRAFVFVYKNDKVQKRAVELTRIIGDKIGISNGIVLGEEVVVKGANFLKDGVLVRKPSDQ